MPDAFRSGELPDASDVTAVSAYPNATIAGIAAIAAMNARLPLRRAFCLAELFRASANF